MGTGVFIGVPAGKGVGEAGAAAALQADKRTAMVTSKENFITVP
jgi:uncharacterized membrane protein YbhN (UPF0104 family)